LLIVFPARAQSITVAQAIEMIGESKTAVVKQLKSLDYVYKGMDTDFHLYTKDCDYYTCNLTVSYKNNLCNALSWKVPVHFASNTMREVLSNGFQLNTQASFGTIQSFQNFTKNLVLTLHDHSSRNNTIVIVIGSMGSEDNQSNHTDKSKTSATLSKPKAVFSPNTSKSSAPFTGLKFFCDDDAMWSYYVSVFGDEIILRLLPGRNNNQYPEKYKALSRIKGKVVKGRIDTDDPPEYLTDRFKFEDGKLLEVNNDGGYTVFSECE
jgi:hypothetical protein